MGSVLSISVVVCACSEYFSVKDVSIRLTRMSNDAISDAGSWSTTLRASVPVLAKGLGYIRSHSKKL